MFSKYRAIRIRKFALTLSHLYLYLSVLVFESQCEIVITTRRSINN
jgi:hypothetical protein